LPATSAETADLQASVNDPKRAVAARAAVAMAMPLVMAFVVLPTASRSVRIWAPSPSTSSAFSQTTLSMDIVSSNVLVGALLGAAVVFLFSGLSQPFRSKWTI